MPQFLYACEKCGFKKKHYFNPDGKRSLSCSRCGEVEGYTRKIGTFNTHVNYQTMEEIMEHEIDPAVMRTYEKIGTEMVNGDVNTLQNLVGDEKMKNTFYENDTWVDPFDVPE